MVEKWRLGTKVPGTETSTGPATLRTNWIAPDAWLESVRPNFASAAIESSVVERLTSRRVRHLISF